jgi:hypothetical protein
MNNSELISVGAVKLDRLALAHLGKRQDVGNGVLAIPNLAVGLQSSNHGHLAYTSIAVNSD